MELSQRRHDQYENAPVGRRAPELFLLTNIEAATSALHDDQERMDRKEAPTHQSLSLPSFHESLFQPGFHFVPHDRQEEARHQVFYGEEVENAAPFHPSSKIPLHTDAYRREGQGGRT